MPQGKKRILIVGGVAGGASAACRARRLSEEAEIILFERGEFVSFANCGLPYHIGGEITKRSKLLVQTPESLSTRFNIDVRINSEVTAIDRDKKEVAVKNLASNEQYTEPYDYLILSPGAEPVRPPLPGFDNPRVFTLRNIPDMDRIKHIVDAQKPQNAVVVGGGYIGLETAEALIHRGVKVSLVELADQVMAPLDPEMTAPVNQCLRKHGVDLLLNTSVKSFSDSNGGLKVELSSGNSLDCDLAILAIGVKPEATLAKDAEISTGPLGGIATDDHMKTSDESVYAVGDAIEVTDYVTGKNALVPLAGPANRQGRIAADVIFGINSTYKKTQGTAICKVFELAAACTGANEKTLKRLNMPYEKIYIYPPSHASYYPGGEMLAAKMLYDPNNGKVLGAQAVGPDGADKRIDVFATAIRAGMTVYDLCELELCYAPPFGSAKDPVNFAGFVAANVMDKAAKICHSEELMNPKDDQFLLDVRTPKEFTEDGTIPGAVNIPLDEIRDRLDEIPRDKELLVFCRVGQRGYLACRILCQNGFDCRNLTGGYLIYQAVQEMIANNQN